MSLEVKWRLAGEDTPGVLEVIPAVSNYFWNKLVKKGHNPCARMIADRVYAAYYREDPDLTLLVVGSYAVLVTVTQPWWSPDLLLSEEAFVRLGTEGVFADALQGLEAFAKDAGCSAVVISDTVSRSGKAYTRLLGMHGYRLVTNQHVKEIDNG